METIGVKIQVEGGKQFKAELDNIKATSKQLSAELKNVANGVDSTGSKAADASRKTALLTAAYDNAVNKVTLFSDKLKKQEENLRSMEAALEAATNEYGENSAEAKKLSVQITQQNAAIAKTKTEIANAKNEAAGYKTQLDALGNEADQNTESQKSLGKATEDAAKKAEKGAKGGWTAFKATLVNLATSVITRVVSGLKSLTSEAINAEDSMAKFSQTMEFAGIDPDVVEEAAAAMKKYADETVYDLKTITNTVAQLGANGVDNFEALVEAAGNLNAVAGGSAQSFESVALVLTQTAGAGKLTTENWRQMMNQIPGAAGVLKDALLEMGAYTGNFEEALKKGEITAEEFNAAIMQVGNEPIAVEAATSVQTFEGAMGNLKASVTSALQAIIQAVGMENITGFLSGLANLITNKVTPAIKVAGDWVQNNLKPVLQQVAEYIQANVVPVVESVWSWIQEQILPVLMELFTWLKDKIWPVVQQIIAWIAANVVPLIKSLAELLGNVLGGVFKGVVDNVKKVASYFIDTFGPAISLVSKGIAGVIDMGKKLVDFFKNMKISIPDIKLPHFKVSGKFSLNPLQVPHLSIDWYDKGGVFYRPSIIGVGEKRPEFVGALDDLRRIVREETGAQTNVNDININVYANDNMNVYQLAEIVSERIQSAVNRRAAVYG